MSGTDRSCEVCGGPLIPWVLAAGELGRCEACGHVRRDLDLLPARRAEAWGGSGIGERLRVSLTYRRLRARLRGTRIDRVLDVGCGDAALLRHFLDDGAQVVGCDPGMLGRPVDPEVGARGAVHPCTLEELPDLGTFDLVLAVHVVEHLPSAVPAWESLLARARRGGTVYAITPAADSAQLGTFGAAWWMLDDPTHVRFYSEDSLARAALAAGAAAVVVRRPRDDSLMCEGMSAANAAVDRGVPERLTGALGYLAAPALVVRRLAAPRWSPVLEAWVTAG